MNDGIKVETSQQNENVVRFFFLFIWTFIYLEMNSYPFKWCIVRMELCFKLKREYGNKFRLKCLNLYAKQPKTN